MPASSQTAEPARAGMDAPPAANVFLVPLLREAIAALAGNDTAQLQRLSRSVDFLAPLPQDAELAEARFLHRLLGALLKATKRNLRLLRRASGHRDCQSYGPLEP